MHVRTDRRQPGWTRTLHATQAPTALRGQVGRWAGEFVGVLGAGRAGSHWSLFSLWKGGGGHRAAQLRRLTPARQSFCPWPQPQAEGRSLALGLGLPDDGAGIRGDRSSLVVAGT